jgi:ketopantoate reductase
VLVIGAGVVGTVYAGLLAAAGHDICVLARGRRLDATITSTPGTSSAPMAGTIASAISADARRVLAPAMAAPTSPMADRTANTTQSVSPEWERSPPPT